MASGRCELCDSLQPDIVLLDVRMPGIDGLEVARHLATQAEPPAVIFITAFDEYALQAFESEAIAYLLKPIRAEKLRAALAKAGRLTRPQLQQVASAARENPRRTHIGVRGREGLKLIPIEEVFCFHADQKYTTVKHQHGEDLIEDSLKTLEEEFAASFVRIHRNSLVNTKYLERIARDASGQHFVHLRGLARAAGGQPAHGGRSQGSLPDLATGESNGPRRRDAAVLPPVPVNLDVHGCSRGCPPPAPVRVRRPPFRLRRTVPAADHGSGRARGCADSRVCRPTCQAVRVSSRRRRR